MARQLGDRAASVRQHLAAVRAAARRPPPRPRSAVLWSACAASLDAGVPACWLPALAECPVYRLLIGTPVNFADRPIGALCSGWQSTTACAETLPEAFPPASRCHADACKKAGKPCLLGEVRSVWDLIRNPKPCLLRSARQRAAACRCKRGFRVLGLGFRTITLTAAARQCAARILL